MTKRKKVSSLMILYLLCFVVNVIIYYSQYIFIMMITIETQPEPNDARSVAATALSHLSLSQTYTSIN